MIKALSIMILSLFIIWADASKSEENWTTQVYNTLASTTTGGNRNDGITLGLGEYIAIGILLVVAIALVIIFLWYCKRRRNNATPRLMNDGNQHKLHHQWKEAGESFEAAAQLFSRQRRCEHDAANNFAEAANCYRKLKQDYYTKKAVKCLEKAAKIYAEMGQFSIAARHLEDAGDLARLIGDKDSSKEAIRLYRKAADFWSGEDSPASAAGSLTKAANLMADIGMLDDAASEFEKLGLSSQHHSLLGFGAKEHMFKSCLCVLCLDSSRCSEKAGDLARKCETFSESDEHSLVKKLADAVVDYDISAFDAAVAEFGRLNNLDDWMRRRLDDARKSAYGESAELM